MRMLGRTESNGAVGVPMKLSMMNVKLVLAILLAVAAGSVSYMTLTRVNSLSHRIRFLYTDSVLPLWGAE
jgi:hypothetical protein